MPGTLLVLIVLILVWDSMVSRVKFELEKLLSGFSMLLNLLFPLFWKDGQFSLKLIIVASNCGSICTLLGFICKGSRSYKNSFES